MRTRVLQAAQVAIVVILVLIALPFVAHTFPAAVGADESYVVLSGSMEPTIPTGSVVYVKDEPATELQEGDIITFYASQTGSPTTHRIHSKIGQRDAVQFVTKGDANDSPDAEPVEPAQIEGELWVTIPLIGHVIMFAATDMGLFLLLVVPSMLWIANEVWVLYQDAQPDN